MSQRPPLSENIILESFDPKHLNLIILPTEKCNLRCTYCYEDFEIGRMKPWVVQAIKSLLETRSQDLASLDISWFGGEPLVARDIVLDISRFVAQLTQEAGISYTANMTTNGYLLDLETARGLIEAGVTLYQVSLDGYGADHDRTRRRHDGGGTFDRIIRNLLSMRDTKLSFTVIIRCHFSPANQAEVERLVQYINAEFGGDMRFRPYFTPIERLGGANESEIRVFSESLEREIQAFLASKLAFPEQLYRLPHDENYVCYASKFNSLMVRPTGTLGKCTVALYDERNSVGRIFPDGTLDIDKSKLKLWANGFRTLDPQELACPWGYMRSDGDHDAKRETTTVIPLESLSLRRRS